MTRVAVSTGAVVLAAGNASRFGAAKQVLSIDGTPMVRRAVLTALAAGLAPVVVVVGAHAQAVRESLAGLDIHFADNPDWMDGMGGSLAYGVNAALTQAPRLQVLMVLLADQPSIQPTDLQAMLEQHARHPDRILAAHYGGHSGPPCLFPASTFAELALLTGPEGARGVLKRHAKSVDTFALPSAALDIDTPADHAAWLAGHRSIEPDAK
jgi:molybdenum cofactor cytidylyltransferase